MAERRFLQVDVFGDAPFLGNALAVIVDGAGLEDAAMQRIARWTNLAETVFLVPPTSPAADYRARIFTPTEELPFAGHPTLGSAHAWLASGGVPRARDRIVQECVLGLVAISRGEEDTLSFAAPPLLRAGPADEAVLCEAAAALGIARESIVAAAWADNGPGWLGVLLASAADVLALRPGPMRLSIGVAGPYPPGSRFAYEVRAFYSAAGTTLEDPVTGSLNAALAQWFLADGRVKAPYLVSQGSAVGHAGVVHVSTDAAGAVWIGGKTVTCVSGVIRA